MNRELKILGNRDCLMFDFFENNVQQNPVEHTEKGADFCS